MQSDELSLFPVGLTWTSDLCISFPKNQDNVYKMPSSIQTLHSAL